MKKLTMEDIDLLEQFWIQKSRVNFFAYRRFIRVDDFKYNWFVIDLCKQLQQFYKDYIAGKRPKLVISTPAQHGKSWAISDFITWFIGRHPLLKIIYSSFSEDLGVRANLSAQKTFDLEKYQKIFPDHGTTRTGGENRGVKNSFHIESWDKKKSSIDNGYFQNTTVQGPITGKTIDIGIIDDPVKGRQEAKSPTISQRIWEWFEDDFNTRFDDKAGFIVIMTRWSTHDLAARLKENHNNVKVINYPALATEDEEHRKEGEALFPEHKSQEFLDDKKENSSESSWGSMYQGNPTIAGGNLFKDHWWGWWGALPQILYKFITADTAQKKGNKNDYTVFQCWGYGNDGRIYLLDKFREKLESPELRTEAEIFYNKHNTKKKKVTDPILRGMYIEDKSSGVGLIQELRKKRLKINEIPRHTDKEFRAEDVSPFVKAGLVCLNTGVKNVGNLTMEGREFPDGAFDDDIDALMIAVEVVFINKKVTNDLAAAMAAGD